MSESGPDKSSPAEQTTRTKQSAASKRSTGRNLPVAIASAVVLYAWIVGSLLWWDWGFIAFLIVCAVVGSFELWRAFTGRGLHVVLTPIAAGATLTFVATHYVAQHHSQFTGAGVLLAGLALMVLACLIGRLRGPVRGFINDAAASVFTVGYVPLLLGTLILLLAQPDGNVRAIYYFILVPCADTGAYAVGSLLGKHKLAPHISPGKTWEGLAGAVGVTCIVGAVLGPLMIGAHWWAGAIIGILLSLAGTVGDLIESMLKRDAGIKDMGRIIPGHGGAMDRMDSLLGAAPIAWLAMLLLV
ncbi:phosphatidate cytidylyltransferase [Propionimicrobium sp. PCR01-08-3]|uniref:phosphatidate cytidylyltransferase n=1 Tax=Propionimicrobium sp. PCR01-08-3 TaxID=3052086 RepID=UPI00255CC233|nr:phosphatidate cytidylyltransferase [Propionimicrobium sp. PCR01-08-3]WIY81591.1 phosphatidate cytidylyltransferase [Propionimicrobium sp. PCR01-08-3]